MAEPFKNLVSAATLAPVFARLAAAVQGLDAARLAVEATAPLDDLELKARVAHVADVIRAHCDPDLDRALDQLVACMPPLMADTKGFESQFSWWPVLSVVERHGLPSPARSLDALRAMTSRFSAEFAVRPFLRADPERALAQIAAWVDDPDPHVRRLVSEGTRPRLPWGERLPAFVADPSHTLPLLDRLRDDPSEYVRRSVANHLGDIAKDHADVAVATATRWRAAAAPHAEWMSRHGLRHLVKGGHPGAIALLAGREAQVEVRHWEVSATVAIGGVLECTATLDGLSADAAIVDIGLVGPRAGGGEGRRVVKWARAELDEGGVWRAVKRIGFRPVTTRVDRPGAWRAELQVNGRVVAATPFELVAG